jgi:hypothetical protein
MVAGVAFVTMMSQLQADQLLRQPTTDEWVSFQLFQITEISRYGFDLRLG